jgi:hypothetical protein
MGWRLAQGGQDDQALRLGAGIVALLLALAIGVWTVRGPLEPGWAKRSGTPGSLLPKPAAVASHATGTATRGDEG